MIISTYINDEPSDEDYLDRHLFVNALVDLAATCNPPMAIALYGTWGVGKTSFMKQIYKALSENHEKIKLFWFNSWEYQFVRSPAVALLQLIVESFESKAKTESKKLLSVIATALCGQVVKSTTDIIEIGKMYEEEHFLQKDENIRIKDYFKKIIERAKKDCDRLVFFIDDLDRCSPENTFSMLEAIKQYLNIDDCVYFLAMDRHVIIETVKQKYEYLYESEYERYVDYIDKIIQLPFIIPPIETKKMEDFINRFLPQDLHGCQKLLVAGLGKNPRQIKRFINILKLNYSLAIQQNKKEIKPQPLTILLMFQQFIPELYKKIINNPKILISLKKESDDAKELIDNYLVTQSGLLQALYIADIDTDINLIPYIYLTETTNLTEVEPPKKSKVSDVQTEISFDWIEDHCRWSDSSGKDGKRAVLNKVQLPNYDFSDTTLKEVIINNSNLTKTNMQNANFTNASFRRSDLTGANLVKAIINDSDLSNAIMQDADLTEASFQHSNLSEAKMLGATLIKTNLQNVNLNGAKLTWAKIRDADFRKADLSFVDFSNATVMNCNFTGATFFKTIIGRTQLFETNHTDNSINKDSIVEPET